MGESPNPDWASQWQALARPWLDAWTDMAQRANPQAAPRRPDGFEQWSRLFGSAGGQGETIERMLEAARGQAAFMQSMLGALAGGQGQPGAAWADALRNGPANPALFEHPMARAFREGSQQWQHAMESFTRGAGKGLDAGEALRAPFEMPAFGLLREHQEHYQRAGLAWIDYREQLERYNALMLDAAKRGFAHFERKLAEREQPGRQIDSLRALYDLWVDAAEEGYAEIALSHEFREVYGDLVNAQMRVRAQMQKEAERVAAEFGMPTRSEIDTLGQRLQELRRELRRRDGATDLAAEIAALRDEVAALKAAQAAAPAAHPPEAASEADGEVLRRVDSPRPARGAAQKRTAARPATTGAAGSFASRIEKYAESSLGKGRATPVKKAAATTPARTDKAKSVPAGATPRRSKKGGH
ncbi:MAG: pha synthase subunit protein [Xanthomonadales bacterium]|nr:pha synthase subunit protein [Xanthomonadales bacterium]